MYNCIETEKQSHKSFRKSDNMKNDVDIYKLISSIVRLKRSARSCHKVIEIPQHIYVW